MTVELALYLYLLVCLLLVNLFTIFYNGVFRNPDQLLCILLLVYFISFSCEYCRPKGFKFYWLDIPRKFSPDTFKNSYFHEKTTALFISHGAGCHAQRQQHFHQQREPHRQKYRQSVHPGAVRHLMGKFLEELFSPEQLGCGLGVCKVPGSQWSMATCLAE